MAVFFFLIFSLSLLFHRLLYAEICFPRYTLCMPVNACPEIFNKFPQLSKINTTSSGSVGCKKCIQALQVLGESLDEKAKQLRCTIVHEYHLYQENGLFLGFLVKHTSASKNHQFRYFQIVGNVSWTHRQILRDAVPPRVNLPPPPPTKLWSL